MTAEATSIKIKSRYNSGAILIHWVMAIAFFMMLASGILMTYVDIGQSLKFQMYQWHKSGGVLLLMAFGLRLMWRWISDIPELPNHFSNLEKTAAKSGHWALYAFMILMPLTGWLMASSSAFGLPTIVFGWFTWPHIQDVPTLFGLSPWPGIAGNEALETLAKNAHFFLAIFFGITIATHIAAVIKHARVDNENLLTRMWWGANQK